MTAFLNINLLWNNARAIIWSTAHRSTGTAALAAGGTALSAAYLNAKFHLGKDILRLSTTQHGARMFSKSGTYLTL
jgi:hypothetical protein